MEKITVNEFMEKYNKMTSEKIKDQLVEGLIVRSYVPILEKKLFVGKMLQKSIIDEGSNIYIDSFLDQINFTFAILGMYTKIDLNDNDNNLFDIYDKLIETGILDAIFSKIDKNEISRAMLVHDKELETFYNKNKSIDATVTRYINKVTSLFGVIVSGSLDALNETVNDNEKMKNIFDNLKFITNSVKDNFKKE